MHVRSRTPRRTRRLHRSTLLVLLLCVCGTTAGTVFTHRVVQQSEHRLLQQKASAAAIIMSGLLGQSYAPAVQSLASAVGADGTVDTGRFGAVSAALTAPQATSPTQQGGLGATGAAILDLALPQVLQTSGRLAVDLTVPADLAELVRAAGVAATDPAHAAFAGLHGSGTFRVLSLLATAPGGRAAYLEVPYSSKVDAGALEAAPQYNQAFGGLDFAIYYGDTATGELMWSNKQDKALNGYVARVFVGLTSTSGFESTAYDAGRRPLMIALEARQPLIGQFSQVFPWLLLAFGLLSGTAVLVLTKKTQRRKDDALVLVDQLKARNTEVEQAVARQQRAEEQLRQSQRLEAIGQLAGGVAHDFNNLLAVIFSYTGFLRTAGQGQPWLEDVDEVDKAAHRAAQLTRQLLLFSRRDAAQTEVVDLRALVADRHRLLHRTLGDDIHVAFEAPDAALCVEADAGELDQVLMNLAVNARDAMPEGGTLTVTLDVADDPEGEPWVRLRVWDTGIGMTPETRERAFEPFFTTKEVGRGTGLGLATVYGIVTRCGGAVSLCSTTGTGTGVTVLLPRSSGTPSPGQTEHEPAVPVLPTRRVLLVEDEESVRRASTRILLEAGYDVVEAANGPEAVTLFDQHRIDVLVSDVVMPGGLSGADLADLLRQDRPGLPVVFTSGYSRDHLTRRGPLPLATSLVPKPFSAATLVDAVRRSLDAEGVLT